MIFTPLLLLPSPKSVSLFGIYFLGAYLGQSFAVPTINMPEGGSRADPNFGLYERLYDSYHGRGGALYIRGYQQKGSPPPEVRGDGGSGRFFHPRLKSKLQRLLESNQLKGILHRILIQSRLGFGGAGGSSPRSQQLSQQLRQLRSPSDNSLSSTLFRSRRRCLEREDSSGQSPCKRRQNGTLN